MGVQNYSCTQQIMAAARPCVTIQCVSDDATKKQLGLPSVFLAPIRPDIVNDVHSAINKNKRQAYAVSAGAGHQTSAESWGTGRAVARIPRVPGGGTHRAGRMFNPTKTWRKWHQQVNVKQRRYAVCSALAASALPSLVMARGHQISEVPECPCVVDDSIESCDKASKAVALLGKIGAYADVEKSKNSRQIRSGKGKMRNRRHVQRRGPLVIFANDEGINKAFRNLSGVEVCSVDRLNLLQLAPGGHLGRFCIFSQSAFEKLDAIYGGKNGKLSEEKKGYCVPRHQMTNSDLPRIINSDEVQTKVRPAKASATKFVRLKKNPLKNLGTMIKLNPYHKKTHIKAVQAKKSKSTKAYKKTELEKKNAKEFFKKMDA